MGTSHYYFDEMRSSFNFQLFALKKLNIYKTKFKISVTTAAAAAAEQKKGT
jgi:hypothetical protein